MPPHSQLHQSSCVLWEPEEELSPCPAEHPSSGSSQGLGSCHCQQQLGLLPSGLGFLDSFSPCEIKSPPRSVGRAGKNLGAEASLEMFGLILAGQCHGKAFLSCSWGHSALCPCAPEAVPRGCAGWDGQVWMFSPLSWSGVEGWTWCSLQSQAWGGSPWEVSAPACWPSRGHSEILLGGL